VIRRILGNSYLALTGQDIWTIGRGEECEIILNDQWISRKHANVKREPDGKFYLEDLGSRNGSLLNGQPVQGTILLQDGDLLTLGTTEIEFHAPVEAPPSSPDVPKTVLITSTSEYQTQVWQAALSSQGLTVLVEPNAVELQELVNQLAASDQGLPDLILIDIEAQKNAYAFCRWCREAYPQLKIVLMSGSRTEIFAVERQWAIHQGAIDLLTGFQPTRLVGTPLEIVEKIDCILKALDWRPTHRKPLMTSILEATGVSLPDADDRPPT
jgi:pSer/pThr/pTyr-binding forkhead associated (FHA) protein